MRFCRSKRRAYAVPLGNHLEEIEGQIERLETTFGKLKRAGQDLRRHHRSMKAKKIMSECNGLSRTMAKFGSCLRETHSGRNKCRYFYGLLGIPIPIIILLLIFAH